MSKKKTGLFCKARDDKNGPSGGLVCGYPLPCPYHTAIIGVSEDPAEVRIPITAKDALRGRHHLEDIAAILLIDGD